MEGKPLYSKIVILDFPPEVAQKPLVCQLIKEYDLLVNILKAQISLRSEGHMVLELSSAGKAGFNKGINFLKNQGVRISTP